MDQAAREGGPTVSAPENHPTEQQQSPEELRHEIEQTRDDLGDTVEALAAKADVKSLLGRR